MTVRTAGMTVAAVGLVTLVLFAVGADAPAGLLALLQLGGLVGTPLAVVLHHELKSWPSVGVVAIALSISLSALAVQSLIWFDISSSPMIVATATVYGVVLAWLLSSSDYGRPEGRNA